MVDHPTLNTVTGNLRPVNRELIHNNRELTGTPAAPVLIGSSAVSVLLRARPENHSDRYLTIAALL